MMALGKAYSFLRRDITYQRREAGAWTRTAIMAVGILLAAGLVPVALSGARAAAVSAPSNVECHSRAGR
jgi:hypothetical protein